MNPSTTERIFLALGLLCAVGCGSGDDGGQSSAPLRPCQQLCQETVARCPGILAQSDCETVFCPLVAPTGCLDAFRAASCADVDSGTGWVDICFPPCTTAGSTCNGNESATNCGDMSGTLRSITLSCTEVCRTKGATYTGVCGTTYGSQVSATGNPVCWCA